MPMEWFTNRLSADQRQCYYAQIARRFSQYWPGAVPEVFVDYDQGLFSLLGNHGPEYGVVHQAALILHEALYLMRIELGQSYSEPIVRLTSYLLSQQRAEVQSNLPLSEQRRLLDAMISLHGLDSYETLFSAEKD
jgi:hypothetical protein